MWDEVSGNGGAVWLEADAIGLLIHEHPRVKGKEMENMLHNTDEWAFCLFGTRIGWVGTPMITGVK